MDENDKIEFKKKYEDYKYTIIDFHNLWDIDLFILIELEKTVSRLLYCNLSCEIDPLLSSDLAEHYIDKLQLLRLDYELLEGVYELFMILYFLERESLRTKKSFLKKFENKNL